MCGTCGCSDTENAVTITDPETGETQIVRQGSILDETQSAAPLCPREDSRGSCP